MKKFLVITLALIASNVVYAHPGHVEGTGLLDGLTHALTGIDHLFMLLSAGVILALSQKKFYYAFLVSISLGLGIALGLAVGSNEIVEYAIIASLALCAVMLFVRTKAFAAPIVLAGIALLHGVAHGAEIPAGQTLGFSIGAIITSSLLVLIGYAITLPIKEKKIFKGAIATALIGAAGFCLGN